MVDSEYSPENYKSSKMNIGTIIIITIQVKRFVTDHLNTKKICKHAVYTFFHSQQDMFLIDIRHKKCAVDFF